MDLRLFFVADYASLDSEGKLNVMGIFNIVRATNFPVRHPELQLIVRFTATAAEAGQTRNLSLKLMEEDGQDVLPELTREFEVPEYQGQPIEVTHIIKIRDIVFPQAGRYEFRVLVDDDDKGGYPFGVSQIEEDPETS
ncbi:MAG: hypothetical protein ACC645_24175 [Pirellulales bacterium]